MILRIAQSCNSVAGTAGHNDGLSHMFVCVYIFKCVTMSNVHHQFFGEAIFGLAQCRVKSRAIGDILIEFIESTEVVICG